MNTIKKIILSSLLICSLVFVVFSGTGVVLAEETASVRMAVNGESETKEYASVMEAVHAIEAMVADNPEYKNYTYELYLDTAQYYIDKDYVMPEVERISLIGNKDDEYYGGGPYYQITHILLEGDVTFQSDLEASDVCFVSWGDADLTAKDFYANELCWFGNDFYPLASVNVEHFYGFSYETSGRLNSKTYHNLDELAEDFDVKNLGAQQIWFCCALNADEVTCATNAVFFRGQNVTSHISNYTYMCSEQNIWQDDGIMFSTIPAMGEEDYVAINVDEVLIKYTKTPSLYWYMGTMENEKTRITVGDFSIDSATALTEKVNLEITMGGYDWSPRKGAGQPDCNLEFNGQITGVARMTAEYSLCEYEQEDGQDWREFMKDAWNATSFRAFTVNQLQKEEIEFDCELVFVNGSGSIGYLNLQKKGNEYWIDFTQPLHELVDLEQYDYMEKDDIYYWMSGGYAIPEFYVGDSDTLTIPSYVNLDGTEYYVYCYYGAPTSLKTNVKTLVLPEDTTRAPYLGGPIGNYNCINSMLVGGNDNSALERFALAGENINFSVDEEGNLYNANKSILYCCPSTKSSYTFPDTVTKIGDSAFLGCDIEELQVPEQVEIVGRSAFRGMKWLKKVEFQRTDAIDFRGECFYQVGSEQVVLSGNGNALVRNEALLYDLPYRDSSNADADIYRIGDLTGDNKVDLADASLALRGSLRITKLKESQIASGDINDDGQVDLADTQLILKHALSILVDFDQMEDMGETNCLRDGHIYYTTQEATFDETGTKTCERCNETIQIGKKNKNYLMTFVTKEATVYEDGEKVITDEDTGYYECETIMHGTNASSMELKQFGDLQYYLYTPSNATENMPLIVYLHGGTNKKADVTALLTTEGFPKYLYDGYYEDLRAYVAIPKLDSSYKGWVNVSDQIQSLIEELHVNYGVDTEKVALTGHSMGGTGTYQLQLRLSDTFACIAPMSGSVQSSEANLNALSKTKIWAFVGTEDTVVDPDSSRTIIKELVEKGADAKITELEGATHFDVPGLVYKNNDLIQWLVNCGGEDN